MHLTSRERSSTAARGEPPRFSTVQTKYEKSLLESRDESFKQKLELVALSMHYNAPEPKDSDLLLGDGGRLLVKREWAAIVLNLMLESCGVSVGRCKFGKIADSHDVPTVFASRCAWVGAVEFAKLAAAERRFYSAHVPTEKIASFLGVGQLAVCKRIEKGDLPGKKRHGAWWVPLAVYEKIQEEAGYLSICQAADWLEKRGLCNGSAERNTVRMLKSKAIRIAFGILGEMKIKPAELEDYVWRAKNPDEFAKHAEEIACAVPSSVTANEEQRKLLALLCAKGSSVAESRLESVLRVTIGKVVADSLKAHGELGSKGRWLELEAACTRAIESIARKYLYVLSPIDFTPFAEREFKYALLNHWEAKRRWKASRSKPEPSPDD